MDAYDIAQPTDTFRWITRDHLQRKHVMRIGVDYCADAPIDESDIPVWTQDEGLKGRCWRPVSVEWRDEEGGNTILQ